MTVFETKKMPTEIIVKAVNLRTGDKVILKKIVQREFPKNNGRWISYVPKFKKKRKRKATERK